MAAGRRSDYSTGVFVEKSRGEGIPAGTCARCGFRGVHASYTDCIDLLRDKVAVLEFRLGAAKKPKCVPRYVTG